MAKVELQDEFKAIHGKVCKNGKVVHRYVYDNPTIYHYHHTYKKGSETPEQLVVQDAFARTQAQVSQQLADEALRETYKQQFKNQTKYATLRGYVFAQLYQENLNDAQTDAGNASQG